MARAPEISIVIPTHKRLDALEMTLDALAGQELEGASVEVVVVCSGAKAGEMKPGVEKLASMQPLPIRVLERRAGGAAGARNAGISAAEGDLILFLNDDAPPASSELVRGHLDAIRERDDPWRGVMGPCRWHPGFVETPVMEWLARTGKSNDFSDLRREGTERPLLYANNLTLSRFALEQVGGFDERFAAYGWAEYDLALRLSDRGFKLAFRPELLVWHYHLHTLSDSLRRMEAVGRAANLLNRLHSERNGLVSPVPSGAKAAVGRVVAPLATRVVRVPSRMPPRLRDRTFQAIHYAALARGYADAPLPDDPALRGGLDVSTGVS